MLTYTTPILEQAISSDEMKKTEPQFQFGLSYPKTFCNNDGFNTHVLRFFLHLVKTLVQYLQTTTFVQNPYHCIQCIQKYLRSPPKKVLHKYSSKHFL